MGAQRVQGNHNVQIRDVEQSLIEITYNEVSRTVPLEPAHIPVSWNLPSPVRLVRAHSGVVPYVERGGLLADLEAWIDVPEPFAGHVIEGRGGAGKTKLAVQLCQEMRESRWLCGFLSRIADRGTLEALVQAPTARLIVIDYAENRAEQVEMLLPLLQAAATVDEPVRVLLLVRTGPARTTNWVERLGDRIDALDATLEDCEVQVLEDTPLRPEDRVELFGAAVGAFAERLRSKEPPASPPNLEEGVFENPLMVVIAAYLAAHGEDAPSTRGELLDEVLAHERRYWRESSEELGADDELLERVVALATLVNAESEAKAAELLRLVTDLCEATVERRNRLARWVRIQYPGPRWWNPLEPDLVGEHLVSRCFADAPETLRGALSGSKPEEITRPLEILARASADHPNLASNMAPILSEELHRLCEVAITQAESVKDQDLLYGGAVTVAAAIDAAVSTVRVHPSALPRAVGLMPPRPDVVLGDLAATLTSQEVEAYRPLSAADETAHAPALAIALNNLSNRLADLGRHEEALAAIEEAVEIRRPLVAADAAIHAPDLAMALNNLSSCLASFGRHEEALAAIEEAVEIRRPLFAADAVAYATALAIALNNLSNRLAELGRHEEALAAIEEAVEIRRPLVAADAAIHAPDLAMALNNLSSCLTSLGRHEEALAAVEEAVEIWHPHAVANPAAYTTDLASALLGLSNCLANLGRREESLAAIERAVEIYRPVAIANPAAYTPDLAMALNNLSNRLADLGRHEEALAAIEEAIEIYRPLVHIRRSALAGALNNLSNCLADLGRHEEALAAIEEAVEIRRPLAAANPAAQAPDLAMALNNISNRLASLGRHEEALAAIEEAVEIRRPLAAANAATHGPGLTRALSNLVRRLKDNGRDEDAENARREVREIAALSPDGKAS